MIIIPVLGSSRVVIFDCELSFRRASKQLQLMKDDNKSGFCHSHRKP